MSRVKGGTSVVCPGCGKRVKPDKHFFRAESSDSEFPEIYGDVYVCPLCGSVVNFRSVTYDSGLSRDNRSRDMGLSSTSYSSSEGVGERAKQSYNREEVRKKRLDMMNKFLLPILKSMKILRNKYVPIVEKVKGHVVKVFEVLYDNMYNVVTIIIDLTPFGARVPVIYHIYVSAQRSPLRPYQVWSKARKLRREVMKFNAQADRLKCIVIEKATSGAIALLRRHGVLIIKKPKDLVRFIANYFKNRYTALLNALRGKRIWGPLALLLLVLQLIAKELGIEPEPENQIDIYTETKLIDAAINGIKAPTTL